MKAVLHRCRHVLRGVRIGEATHPGPRFKRRRRVVPGSGSSGSEPELTLLDTPELSATQVHFPEERLRRAIRPVREGTDLLYTQWDSDPRTGSQEVEEARSVRDDSLPSNRDPENGHLPIDQPSRRLVLASGERLQVSPEAVFEPWTATSPSQEVPIPNDRDHEARAGEFGVDTLSSGEMDTDRSSDTESLVGASEASGEEIVDTVPEVEVEMPAHRAVGHHVRAALVALDAVDLSEIFRRRAVVMKSIPHFLRGPFRNALLMALEEVCAVEGIRRERGWKLFLLLPRLLLHRPPRGGTIPKHKLVARFESFASGQWSSLLRESEEGCEIAATARARHRRRPVDDIAARAERAQALVMMGEVSSGRQALEGAAVAPGTDHTLRLLTDASRRPAHPTRELTREILEFVPEAAFNLDDKKLAQNLRSSRRGAAPGPSGMSAEHLRPLLSNPRDFQWFFRAGEQLARGEVPPAVVDAIRLGRMTG